MKRSARRYPSSGIPLSGTIHSVIAQGLLVHRPALDLFAARRVISISMTKGSSHTTQIPSALWFAFDDFAKAEDRVRSLLLDRDPDQLNWSPEPGRWSILQCVE